MLSEVPGTGSGQKGDHAFTIQTPDHYQISLCHNAESFKTCLCEQMFLILEQILKKMYIVLFYLFCFAFLSITSIYAIKTLNEIQVTQNSV